MVLWDANSYYSDKISTKIQEMMIQKIHSIDLWTTITSLFHTFSRVFFLFSKQQIRVVLVWRMQLDDHHLAVLLSIGLLFIYPLEGFYHQLGQSVAQAATKQCKTYSRNSKAKNRHNSRSFSLTLNRSWSFAFNVLYSISTCCKHLTHL